MVYIVIGPAPDLSGVMYAGPGAHAAGQDHPLERAASGARAGRTTQSRSPPPIQSIEASPRPTSSQAQWIRPRPREERLEVVAVEERDAEPHQRGQDGDLEAAEEELGGEESGHEARKE